MGDVKDIVWYISRDSKEYGPFNREDFERFEREHQLISIDLVWHTGLANWIPYRDYRKSNPKQPRSAAPISRIGGFYAPVRAVARLPISLIKTAFRLATAPHSFGRERIDRKPGDIHRATTFWLNMFSIVFLSFSATAYLNGFSGASEVRELLRGGLIFAFVLPILYLLNIGTRQSVHFSGVVQAALYVHGLFLIVTVVPLNILITYVTPPPEMGRGELDIISTEYEKCLTEQSLMYWVMRGDLQFFIRPAITPFTSAIEFVREYYGYVLGLPFAVLFGMLLKGRYSASASLNTVFAAASTITVNIAWESAMEKAQGAIANSSTCRATFFQQASQKYSKQLLGKQIAYNINQQIARNMQVYQRTVRFTGDKFVMDLIFKPTTVATPESMESLRRGGLAFYCENNTAFRYARQLNIPLHYIVRRHDGLVIINEELRPASCPS